MNATIKLLKNNLFEVKYAHNNDLYGIGCDEVVTKYITFENDNLKQLAERYGVANTENIPNKIQTLDFSQMTPLTEEQLQYIMENCVKEVISAQVSEENFYKNKDCTIEIKNTQVLANCYGMNISGQQLKNIIISLLQKIAIDDTCLDIILDKCLEIAPESQITTNDITDLITNVLNELEDEEFESIKIEIYEVEGQLVRMVINNCTIDYEKAENAVRLIISGKVGNSEETVDDESEVLDEESTVDEIDDAEQNEISNEGTVDLYRTNTQNSNSSSVVNSTNTLTGSTNIIANMDFEIEIAKQTSLGQSNIVAIFTLTNEDDILKISYQDKMNQDASTEEIQKNQTLNISNGTTTYFTIEKESSTVPSEEAQVEIINNENSAIINNYEQEELVQLMQAIVQRIQFLYQSKLQNIYATQQQTNNNVEQAQENTEETRS